jgi:hypothetical protein
MRIISISVFGFLSISLLIAFIACRPGKKTGRDLKNGTFHFYTPANEHFIIFKTDSLDTEINTATNDSTFWKIEWLDDSTYNSTFIRKTYPDTGLRQHFNLNTKIQIHITKVLPRYYLFESVASYMGKTYKYNDTVWFQSK